VSSVDALAGEADTPPWSCEGEPALRVADLDGDGCPEVLAQYRLRPPSGDVFDWAVVLRCDPAATPALAFDAERSARWRAALLGPAAPRTLRAAEALLKKARP
jgi:hypothetical protein